MAISAFLLANNWKGDVDNNLHYLNEGRKCLSSLLPTCEYEREYWLNSLSAYLTIKTCFCRCYEWKSSKIKLEKSELRSKEEKQYLCCFRYLFFCDFTFFNLWFLVSWWGNERKYFYSISKSSQDWRIFLFERRVRFVVQWKISFVKKSHFKYKKYCSKKNIRDRFEWERNLSFGFVSDGLFHEDPKEWRNPIWRSFWNKGKAIRLIMTALYASLKD